MKFKDNHKDISDHKLNSSFLYVLKSSFKGLQRSRMIIAFLLALFSPAHAADKIDVAAMEKGFQNPPHSALPQVWWHWIGGNVTREGITADLESMKRVGIGEAQILTISGGQPGQMRTMDPQFFEMVEFAAQECERLGLTLTLHNCSGWSNTGGPWITPEQSMKEVTYSEIQVVGGTSFDHKMPMPPQKRNFYKDIVVLAFPTPSDEVNPVGEDNRVTFTTNAPDIDVSGLDRGMIDGNKVKIEGNPDKEAYYLQATFEKPVLLTTAMFKIPSSMATGGMIWFSEDGDNLKPLGQYELKPVNVTGYATAKIGVKPVQVKAIRFIFGFSMEKMKFPPISDVKFTCRTTNPHLIEKAIYDKPHQAVIKMPSYMLEGMNRELPEGAAIKRSTIMDISSHMQPDGALKWNVPQGNWTIVRFGYTTTGVMNACAQWSGLESDKFDPAGIEAAWSGMMAPIIKRLGPLSGKVLVASLIDSYEVGGQNWTPRMADEFKKACGYDILSFLPAFTGRTIDSPAITERFFWDFRRTVSDLIAKNHYAHFTTICNRAGLKSSAEPYIGPFEGMQSGAGLDIPMAEFWQDLSWESVKMVSSVANGYGKSIVGAESYTSHAEHGSWKDDPYAMKAFGDRMYCLGVNRFIYHSFVHQPWLNVKPGLKLGAHGCNMNRANTWFEMCGGWIKYLARCQYLLQLGRTQVDVAYFCGQGSPNMGYFGGQGDPNTLRPGNPPLPRGYDYDAINYDLLMNHAKMENGRLVLKSGASYAILVLNPDDPLITPDLLGKLKGYVKEGLTLVGPPPALSPSLRNYPQCDQEIKNLVQELWGNVDLDPMGAVKEKVEIQNQVGKGRVILGKSLEDVLSDLGIIPDCQVPPEFEYIHKKLGNMDYYFVSNQKDQAITKEVTFRIAGKSPELFHPDTGKIEDGIGYSVKGKTVTVPLSLDPGGAVFVMFRKTDAGGDRVVAPKPGMVKARQPIVVEGSWKLSFPPKWGAPESIVLDRLISWHEHAESGVKYFSGTATYSKVIDIPAESLGKSRQVYLDLGVVKNLAKVKLNGVDLGVCWKPPYRVDITLAAKAGKNQLEIELTNLWPNRLIGDEQLPDDSKWTPFASPHAERTRNNGQGVGLVFGSWPEWFLKGEPSPTGRFTFSNVKHYFKDSPLFPSGLIGTVELKFYKAE